MIADPIAPKIPPQLDAWSEDAGPEIEIDRALAKGLDCTASTKISADASRIESMVVTGAALDTFELTDVACTKLEGAAVRAYKTNLLRVALADCRLTGAEFAEGNFEDCTFRNVKFDEAGFRFATFKRVRFENCILRQADFSNAKLSQVTFTGCDLEATNFVSASCTNVDITGEDFTQVKGVLGLKGATISTEQLMQLAPLLASELGFRVKD
jgi:uncharacterized protein YjbI with pentapeptide repeats